MAAAWAILAVIGGGAGFAVGMGWGWMTAVVDAFVGAWLLTGLGVTLQLLRHTPPVGPSQSGDLDLGEATDQMVAALRSAVEISERMDERVAPEAASAASPEPRSRARA